MTRDDMIQELHELAMKIRRHYVAISEGGKPDQDTEWLANRLTELVIELEQRPRRD